MGYSGDFVLLRSDSSLSDLRIFDDPEWCVEDRAEHFHECRPRPGGWQTFQVHDCLPENDDDRWLSRLVTATGSPVMIASVVDSDVCYVRGLTPSGVAWSTFLDPVMAADYAVSVPPPSQDEAPPGETDRDRRVRWLLADVPGTAERIALWAAESGFSADREALRGVLSRRADPFAEDLFFELIDACGLPPAEPGTDDPAASDTPAHPGHRPEPNCPRGARLEVAVRRGAGLSRPGPAPSQRRLPARISRSQPCRALSDTDALGGQGHRRPGGLGGRRDRLAGRLPLGLDRRLTQDLFSGPSPVRSRRRCLPRAARVHRAGEALDRGIVALAAAERRRDGRRVFIARLTPARDRLSGRAQANASWSVPPRPSRTAPAHGAHIKTGPAGGEPSPPTVQARSRAWRGPTPDAHTRGRTAYAEGRQVRGGCRHSHDATFPVVWGYGPLIWEIPGPIPRPPHLSRSAPTSIWTCAGPASVQGSRMP